MPLPRNGWVQPVEGVPGGIPIPVTPVAPSNEPHFVTGRTPVPTPGTAVQLNGGSSIPIPGGYYLVIKAPKATTGTMFIGNSQANAQDVTVSYPLDKQEVIEYGIADVNLVWVDASVAGEEVVWTVEQV
jgi:hypothetical protein